MTDYASIEYVDENAILAGISDPETVYVERLIPLKLRNYERYVSERSFGTDIKIILATLKAIAR
jgi:lipopolysaccharide/colanic/teichoic acid biosynthesis glycosyltransferase